MNTSTYSPHSNKCGVPGIGEFDKKLGEHSIVILFRGISNFKCNIEDKEKGRRSI